MGAPWNCKEGLTRVRRRRPPSIAIGSPCGHPSNGIDSARSPRWSRSAAVSATQPVPLRAFDEVSPAADIFSSPIARLHSQCPSTPVAVLLGEPAACNDGLRSPRRDQRLMNASSRARPRRTSRTSQRRHLSCDAVRPEHSCRLPLDRWRGELDLRLAGDHRQQCNGARSCSACRAISSSGLQQSISSPESRPRARDTGDRGSLSLLLVASWSRRQATK